MYNRKKKIDIIIFRSERKRLEESVRLISGMKIDWTRDRVSVIAKIEFNLKLTKRITIDRVVSQSCGTTE